MPTKLTPRLMTAVPYIRGGRLVADIGTDHAYLPIYLCEQRRLSPVTAKNGETLCAIAADINKGPVERADQYIAEARLTKYIKTLQTDGLTGLDAFDPFDIIIFGMGGELIAKIIDDAPFVKDERIRLILQPMTKAEILREYLAKNGFSVVSETLSEAVGRQYFTICAEFDGKIRRFEEIEYLLGKFNLEYNQSNPIFSKIVDRNIKAAEIKIAGKEKAGDDAAEEKALLALLSKIKEGQQK